MKEFFYSGGLLFLFLGVLTIFVGFMALYSLIFKSNKNNVSVKYARSKLTDSFNEKMSELILQADSKERSLFLSNEIIEIMLNFKNDKEGFKGAISKLEGIANSNFLNKE